MLHGIKVHTVLYTNVQCFYFVETRVRLFQLKFAPYDFGLRAVFLGASTQHSQPKIYTRQTISTTGTILSDYCPVFNTGTGVWKTIISSYHLQLTVHIQFLYLNLTGMCKVCFNQSSPILTPKDQSKSLYDVIYSSTGTERS